MKRILFILLAVSAGLKADQVIRMNSVDQNGYQVPQGVMLTTDTNTYFNNLTPGVLSAVVDTANWTGVAVKVTATGSAPLIKVQFSNTPTAATFTDGYQLVGIGDKPIRANNRYLKFLNASSTQVTATVSYLPIYPPNAQAITVGGIVSVTGNVSLTAGTASIGNLGTAGNVSLNAGTATIGNVGITNTVNVANTAAAPMFVSRVADTATQGFILLTATAFTGLTTNASSTFSVTFTAGSFGYRAYIVYVSAETGVSSLRGTPHNGVTVPTTFGASNGAQFYPGDVKRMLGYYSVANSNFPYFSLRASALSGATSGTAWIEIWGQP